MTLVLALACSARPAAESPPPPPKDRAQLIYFVMVDRFANGDATNDPPGTDPSDPQAWHGGDLAGLTQHLDWLEELGVTTLWLSPLTRSRHEKFYEWGAFHGYWVEDHRELEPAFGTEDELRALRAGLQDRGMSLVLDMVYNHAAMDGVLLQTHPDWFHPFGGIEDWTDPFQLQNHRVHGLPDLDQDNPEAYAYLLSASRGWLDRAQPSGIRVDAVRHMPPSFLARLDADLGDVWMLAEIYDGDPLQLQRAWAEGGFEAVFDFPLHFAMVDHFCRGEPVGRIAAMLSLDRVYEDPSRLVTFLDNHDLPRLASTCSPEASAEALELLFSLRGTPSLSWGTEVGLEGAEEPHNRADMRFVEHPLQGRIAELAAQRSASPALALGRSWISGFDEDTLRITREAEGERLSLVVTAQEVSIEPGGPEPLEGTATVHFDLPEGFIVTGAGPELGNWDPALGVRSAELPRGTVIEYKQVDRRGDQPVWEEGPNRYRWVE